MRSRWIVLLLAAGIALGAMPESHVRIVRISFIARGVEMSHAAAGAPPRWSAALLNAPIVESEELRTTGGGEAEVQLECGSALRLAPNSEMSFPQLSLRDDGVRTTRVALGRGTAFFTLRRADSVDFKLEVGGATIEIPSGAVRVEAASGRTMAAVELLAGHATVNAGSHSYELKKDARFEWTAGSAVWAAASAPDQWQRWSQSRDEAFDSSVASSGLPAPEVAAAAGSIAGNGANSEANSVDSPSAMLSGQGAPSTAAAAMTPPPGTSSSEPSHIFPDLVIAPPAPKAAFTPAPSAHQVPACSNLR